MELLVSTASALLRVKIGRDYSLENVTVLEQDRGVYFGVTLDVSHFYILTRHFAPLRKANGHGPHAIVVYDRSFVQQGHIPLPEERVSEGHQMVLAGGIFHICNTSHNALTLVSKEGKILEDFYPNPRYARDNYNHLNTVFIDTNSMLLGFANRFRNSFFLEYSRSPREFRGVDALGFATHNVIRTPSLHVVCDSRNGSLITWRAMRDESGQELPVYRAVLLPSTGEVDCVLITAARYGYYLAAPATRSFTRGLALDNAGTLVCGIESLSQRDERHATPTRIVVMPEFEGCLEGKKINPVFHQLGCHGDVHDIRLADQYDWGHPVVDK